MSAERKRQRIPGNGWYAPLVALGFATAFLIGMDHLGGNEHGIDRFGPPYNDTMPSYGVAPLETGANQPAIPPHAKTVGALVCPQAIVFKDRYGTLAAIINPVVDSRDATEPLDLVNIDDGGPVFKEFQPNDVSNPVVFNLNGTPDGSGRLHDCVPTDITTTQVVDASKPANRPYILTEPGSTTQEGDTIPLSAGQAVAGHYVSYAITGSSLPEFIAEIAGTR